MSQHKRLIAKALKKEKSRFKVEAKRSVELWIYSFADMYLILVFFFIVIAVAYSVRPVAEQQPKVAQIDKIPSAGRGPASAQSVLSVEFARASSDLSNDGIEDLKLLLAVAKNNHQAILEIEGYADTAPVQKGGVYSSNLDLSARRAVRVAEWFMQNGVSPARVRTYSYGNGQTWSGGNSKVPTDRRVVVKMYSRGGL